jgi:hypothetical protein
MFFTQFVWSLCSNFQSAVTSYCHFILLTSQFANPLPQRVSDISGISIRHLGIHRKIKLFVEPYPLANRGLAELMSLGPQGAQEMDGKITLDHMDLFDVLEVLQQLPEVYPQGRTIQENRKKVPRASSALGRFQEPQGGNPLHGPHVRPGDPGPFPIETVKLLQLEAPNESGQFAHP